jgi:hypothetical protein
MSELPSTPFRHSSQSGHMSSAVRHNPNFARQASDLSVYLVISPKVLSIAPAATDAAPLRLFGPQTAIRKPADLRASS